MPVYVAPTDPTAWTEADLLRNVRKLAAAFGWLCYHSWTSIHSPRGYPDLTLVRRGQGQIIFAELKRDGKNPTAAQQEWLDALAEVERQTDGKVKARVWRPADLEAIMEELR